MGISCCGCLSAVTGLLEGDGGRRGLQLDPVQMSSVLQIVTPAESSVFDGQDVHVVVDFLLVKLRDCLTDPVLLSCPALSRVSQILFFGNLLNVEMELEKRGRGEWKFICIVCWIACVFLLVYCGWRDLQFGDCLGSEGIASVMGWLCEFDTAS